ncbi:MAG: LamB/YcsF family protein [Nocardioides sp.]
MPVGGSGGRRLVDLNADLGEEITDDSGLLAVVSSANVACGYHAGNQAIMRAACAEAVTRGVSVGAQVSYADRANFGRVRVEVAPDILTEQVADQVGTLRAIAAAEGTRVRYLKPHGALYHRVIADEDQAFAVLAGSDALPVLGFPGSVIVRSAESMGRRAYTEGFPDRAYDASGRLVSRDVPGAVIADTGEIAARALRLATGVDSVCVHGDTPGAVAHAAGVRRAMEGAGWTLRGL